MVRLSLSSCPALALALALPLAAPLLAAAAPGAPATPAPSARSAPTPAPTLGWHERVAVAVAKLQTEAPELLARIEAMQPDHKAGDDLIFNQPELHDPRAAPILLRRLLAATDPIKVRCAIVDALPRTGGDWQEGAAALIALDSSPRVRKQLVATMRYAGPHSVRGLRSGFKDEDPEINVAAARIAGFSSHGAELYSELYAATFDSDWDLRAAAVQALGMLKLPRSREVLIKALGDESRDVRLQALLALEQLDPEGLLALPELEVLARDRKSHRISRKATALLRKRRAAAR